MRKFLARVAAAFTAAAVAFTPIAAKAPAARPALWKLADSDTTIYLFGTIHLLPKGTEWRTAKFDAALGQRVEPGGRNDRSTTPSPKPRSAR